MPKTATRPADLPPGVNALLTVAQVIAATGYDERTLRRMRAAGTFPKPDTPEGKEPRWTVATFNAWVESYTGKAGDQ